MNQIVIVGGGAGGLELATRLGKKLGKNSRAKIILIDQNPTHLWKPLLHEVAAGTLDAHEDELSYLVHASHNDYSFQLGRLSGLDRTRKVICLEPIKGNNGTEILPYREIHYDILILAIGSLTNDLNIPGVKENCLFLDKRDQADIFQQIFLKNILRLQNKLLDELNIIIVGGGATGVELAAELNYMMDQVEIFGFDQIDPKRDLKITLIEAAPRILSNLPERISTLVTKELLKRGIQVLTNERVKEVKHDTIITASSKVITGTMIVWAAGVKVDEITHKLDGLPLNHLNQIEITDTLQTVIDDHIFAMGDCGYLKLVDSKSGLPPRAQVASQQAIYLAKAIPKFIKGKHLSPFKYKDYGSLISMSERNTFGSLMGKFTGSFLLEGKIARLVYLSLYKKHQSILHGPWRVFLLTLANRLTRRIKPHFKLH